MPDAPLPSFVKGVRDRTICSPTRRGFDPAVWTEAYRQSAQSAEDEALYGAGLIVDRHLSHVRQCIEALPGLPGSPEEQVRQLIGQVNGQVAAARLGFRAQLEHEAARPKAEGVPQMAAFFGHGLLTDMTGTTVTVDQITESGVDGLAFPLRSVYQGAIPSAAGDVDLETAAYYVLYGQIYGRVEGLWKQAVAGRVRIYAEDGQDVYDEDDAHAQARMCAATRRDALNLEILLRTAELRRGTTHVYGREPWGVHATGGGRRRPVRAVRLRTGTTSAEIDEIDRIVTGRLLFVDDDAEGIQALPLPAYAGMSIDAMVRVWEAVQVMAARLQDEVAASLLLDPALTDLAPTVSRRELSAAVRRATGLPPKRVEAALSALVQDPAAWTGPLWFRPLVQIGDDELAVVLAPLLAPNLRWLIEHWMQEGGLDMDQRGTLFESHLVQNLAKAIGRKPRLDAQCHPRPLTLRGPHHPAGRDAEEIDLLVRVGGTVLVGEAKCRVFPSDDPNSWASLAKVLRHGSEQAERKAEFVRANRDAVLAATGWSPDALPDPFDVVPVVVVSLADGAGLRVSSVPVVDSRILEQFFHPGHLPIAARQGQRLKERHVIPFYARPEDAEGSLRGYLDAPPQLAVYAPFVQRVDQPFPIAGLGSRVVHRYPTSGPVDGHRFGEI